MSFKIVHHSLVFFIILLIHLYRWTIKPMIGECCRFYPTCSEYAMAALRKYGVLRGSYLTCLRLIRCQAWCSGGDDPLS